MTYSLHTLNSTAALAPEPRLNDDTSPGVVRRVLRESSLFVGLLLLLFWMVAMLSHSAGDAAWSTSGVGEPVRNWGGRLGAWLSDGSYYLLGFSVWWLLAALWRLWLAALGRWLRDGAAPAHQNGRWDRWRNSRTAWGVGLTVLLVASAAMEWSRLYRWESHLPGHAGGVLGYSLGPLGTQWLGSTGLALLSIGLGVVGASWVFRFSWAAWAEGLGRRVDGWLQAQRERRERERDEQLGREAARARQLAADPTLALSEPQASASAATTATLRDGPTLGEPPAAVDGAAAPAETRATDDPPWDDDLAAKPDAVTPVAVAAPAARRPAVSIEPVVAHVAQSDRAAKEKQTGLFSELDAFLPTIDLLDAAPSTQETVSHETLEMTSRLIEKKLKDFGVQVTVVAAYPGPVITRYEIEPATGVKGSQIVGLAKDLARSLSLVSIRVVETIPGKNCMALELPNARRQTIRLSEILGSQVYHKAKSLLTMGLGKDIVGNPVVADLGDMPHCLVAGTTGSGKSVGINAMILSILYKAEPHDVRFLMIDPKMLEMSVYEGIPHLLAPVVTDMKQAANGLNWCVAEMERRYKLLSALKVRNLAGYNAKIDAAIAREEHIPNPFSLTPDAPEPLKRLPHIVIVIDELADLMMVVGKKIEELIARLAQKARASGIHLILATQRPSVDVITGLIKANVPTRLSFQVSSKIDSRTILDEMGAETLLGMGDMLYKHKGTVPVRVHGCFVSDDEVLRVVEALKERGEPDYIDGVLEGGTAEGDDTYGGIDGVEGGEKDPNYDRAVKIVLENNKASISLVQRHLGIGYNKAANLLDAMEKAGLVSSMNARGQRDILVPNRGE